MIDIIRALKNDRTIKALTGLSAPEFIQLSQNFGREIQEDDSVRYEMGVNQGTRKRKPGGGRIGKLKTFSEKLFFIPFYFKSYPTFDILGLIFDIAGSCACRNVHKLTPILEKVLGKRLVLPKRKINDLEGFLEVFLELENLFIDGTERPIQRPKNFEKQKENYSGKKKAHTRKNIIISEENKRIDYLGPTVEGKKHDYRMFKELFPPSVEIFPENTTFWMDLGFIGLDGFGIYRH